MLPVDMVRTVSFILKVASVLWIAYKLKNPTTSLLELVQSIFPSEKSAV